MKQIKTLLIDDEINLLDLLERYLKKHTSSSINIVGKATSKKEGIELIKKHTPELVFLDIHLSDGNGFELLTEISNLALNLKVIFVSAYDHFAIKAFRLNAIDYLLKPIQIDELKSAVNKAINDLGKKRFINNDQIEELFSKTSSYNTDMDFIAVSSQKKINLAKIDDIIYAESDGSYTTFFLKDGSTVLSTKNLGEYENRLNKKLFYRIHHSYLINLKHIINISKDGGHYSKMINGKNLPISKRRMGDLNKLLKLKS
ncbi:LytR/AlgR family response regulator transcription factor [Flavivirga spongiicola]|uniref:LytTR family DNA-binding domain-containing protein n=1 Tax=Flavivirga spongiicola TaxID=421621 RepID=A0ABU7XYD5_9FLAO|nr:LytTR family DNA-binding domain-containing protein [Flavivirga sp. MEBiC05379]MDO5980789.1 LytTR family DNA-binding domain-containing protein [Flavivirga sp. MEBiC05379]